MSYFILQEIEFKVNPNNLKLSFIENNNINKNDNLNPSLREYLNKSKTNISEYNDKWNNFKKYTYPYEFIHSTIPDLNCSISKLSPISRAFYKLVEIYSNNNLLNYNRPINTFHLAEGPGGFIEATDYLRNNQNDKYYGMTLINKNTNIPNWHKMKNLLTKNPNIKIELGVDNKGDLFNHKNLCYCNKNFKNNMDIITADGGFDFSVDFNNQERNAFRLILTQIAYALCMQKKGGSFVLKVFDIFNKSTFQSIYLLSCFYSKVIITKPYTSRYANSEKYIICKDFKFSDTTDITNKFIKILKILESFDFNKYSINKILDVTIPFYYLSRVKEVNAIFGHKQIDNINSTIKLITYKDKQSKVNILQQNNIQKSITWCIKNNIPYNKNYEYKNIFSGYKIKNI